MIRRVIHIDEERCNGCGLCVSACHEGAIGLVNGKARLLRDDYCDGLGDCLPACPAGAISFVEREAAAYDEAAVLAAKAAREAAAQADGAGKAANTGADGGCPGSLSRLIERMSATAEADGAAEAPSAAKTAADVPRPVDVDSPERAAAPSELRQWPIQIKLAPPRAPYFEGADLLVAADCTAFSYGDFHARFMRGRITLVGCPKLDAVDYAEKLTMVLAENDVRSVTVARMEVPCCGGIEAACRRAIEASGKQIPLQVVTLSTDGRILNTTFSTS